MEASSLCHALITTLVFLLPFTSNIAPCTATPRPKPIPTEPNTDYIKKSCGATLYPDLCYSSLSIYAAKIQTSPKRLASVALSVALSATRSASAAVGKLSKRLGLTPREVAAMADCVEEVGDSVDELQRSVEEMAHISGPTFELYVSDIRTWVSAAMTDEDTCMEGFGGKAMNGQVKSMVRREMVKVAHLASNALALLNGYAAAHEP